MKQHVEGTEPAAAGRMGTARGGTEDAIGSPAEPERTYGLQGSPRTWTAEDSYGADGLAPVQRRGSTLGGFASRHRVPLVMIGASLGWLTLRFLKNRRTARSSRRLAEMEAGGRFARPEVPLSAATTSGEKLMGVRVHDAGYRRRQP